jgi:signal transduction histidine kinase
VRDTGIGMNEQQIEHALRPFAPLQNSLPPPPSAAGLGLPLAKALAEANRAVFQIKSGVNSGTLVEVIFPATRVMAK